MIKLSSASYSIYGIQPEEFWKKLDSITFGQKLNPELGYTTPFLGKLDNVFAGRKKKNTFSVYLYQPITASLRTEILAKGIVIPTEKGLKINVRYEIPFWSIMALVFIGTLILGNIWLSGNPPVISSVFTGLILVIYSIVVYSNHHKIKQQIQKQFLKFERERDQNL